MRIIIYTGKGGVGKTSVAAATALKSASRGLKTLVVSTDPAHSLGDSLDIPLTPEPVPVLQNLWAQEIDTIHEVEKSWGRSKEWLTNLLTKNIKDITAEELTVFPGLEDLLSLLRIMKLYREKTYDVVIVDCAPTGETMALLSFPEVLQWWMEKIFPIQKKAVKLLRPVAEPLLGLPLPSDHVLREIENIYSELEDMKAVFSDRNVTSIRIVVNPEKMVIKEAQRSFTYLNIYNFNVDAVVVNRVIPPQVSDGYFRNWKEIQGKYKEMIVESFLPLPIYYAPLMEKEVVGLEMLNRLGDEIFRGQDPVEIKYNIRTQQVEKEGDDYIYSIYIPFLAKGDLTLNQKGEELNIKAGNAKRNITLPRTLLGLPIKNARFEKETLKIRFGGDVNEK